MTKSKLFQLRVYAGAILCLALVKPQNAFAVEPATVAAGAAAATVVVTTIRGLSEWIDNQSDDVAAAVLASSYGKHGLTQNEEKNTGWSWVGVDEVADDTHGHGFASAWAEESLFGSWAGAKTDPFALAWTKPLHTLPDDHHAKGFASASVDGHVKATTKEANAAASFAAPVDPPVNDGTHCNGSNSAGGICTTYSGWNYTPSSGTPGDVWLTIAIPTDDFLLQADKAVNGQGFADVLWEYSIQIDGIEKFFTSITLNEAGNYEVVPHDGIAGLSRGLFRTSIIDDVVNLLLAPNSVINGANYYVTDILLDELALPDSTGLGEEAQYNVSVSSTLTASANIPEPGTISLLLIGFGWFGISRAARRG